MQSADTRLQTQIGITPNGYISTHFFFSEVGRFSTHTFPKMKRHIYRKEKEVNKLKIL